MATKKSIIGSLIILSLIFSGFIFKLQYDRSYFILYKDGNVIAKSRWLVYSDSNSLFRNSTGTTLSIEDFDAFGNSSIGIQSYVIKKRTSFQGSILEEEYVYEQNIYNIKDFPNTYSVIFTPDTNEYRLIWEIKSDTKLLDEKQCIYKFKEIVIDITLDCSKLDHAEISKDKILLYFKNSIGKQEFKPILTFMRTE